MAPAGTIEPLYAVSGFFVGVLVGVTGVGGGSLMTPLLVLLFGIHPSTAVGTDLLYAAITKSVGTTVHGYNRSVDWRIVGRLASGSVPATLVTGLLLLYWIGANGNTSSRLISIVLGVAVLITAVLLLGRGWLLKYFGSRISPEGPRHARALTMLTGAVLGVLVTLSSVGAGALGVTALFLLYPRMLAARVPEKVIRPALACVLAVVGGRLVF